MPQCDGIWRPPEFGSSFAPTAREQHLERRHAEREAQRAIAIVRIEPVVARAQVHAGGGQHRFVAGAADLEEDQALVLELDLLVVEAARQQHRAVGPQQIVARQAVPARARRRPQRCARRVWVPASKPS